MNTTELRFSSNILRDIEHQFISELTVLYPEGEISAVFRILCESYLGYDSVSFLLHRNDAVNQSDMLRFHWALEDLKKERPIQHIIGYATFCGCKIEVNPNVLIPRPETEEIVENVLSRYSNSRAPIKAIDICTGSGCIAIAVKKRFPQCDVYGLDISPSALDVARRNAEVNNVKVAFFEHNLLETSSLCEEKYDLILSNPPYIPSSDAKLMSRNVTAYEPPEALFVPDDNPLVFYEAIARFATRYLTDKGLLAVEINERFGADVSRLFNEFGFNSQVHQDYKGKDRCVTAVLSSQQ